MKRFAALAGTLVLFAAAAPVMAQEPGAVVIPVPDPWIVIALKAFAIGGVVYKMLNGLKDLIPSFGSSALVLRILNFAGNFLITGGACFVMGEVHDAFDLVKCLVAAVMGALVAAGFQRDKKASDMARAGGA